MLLSRVNDALSLRLNSFEDLPDPEHGDELELRLLEVFGEAGISTYQVTESRRLAHSSVQVGLSVDEALAIVGFYLDDSPSQCCQCSILESRMRIVDKFLVKFCLPRSS